MPPGRWVPPFLDLSLSCRGILVRLECEPTGCKLMRRAAWHVSRSMSWGTTDGRPRTSIAACSLGQGQGASGAGSAGLDLCCARCWARARSGRRNGHRDRPKELFQSVSPVLDRQVPHVSKREGPAHAANRPHERGAARAGGACLPTGARARELPIRRHLPRTTGQLSAALGLRFGIFATSWAASPTSATSSDRLVSPA